MQQTTESCSKLLVQLTKYVSAIKKEQFCWNQHQQFQHSHYHFLSFTIHSRFHNAVRNIDRRHVRCT